MLFALPNLQARESSGVCGSLENLIGEGSPRKKMKVPCLGLHAGRITVGARKSAALAML